MSRSAVLVVGVPRSGSSWVGRVLGSTPDAVYLGEPDNHEHCPFALRAKLGLRGRFYPDVRPAETVPVYEQLWREAFASPLSREYSFSERARRALALRLLRRASDGEVRRSISDPAAAPRTVRVAARLAVPERPPAHDGNLVVKSVHAQLALEWIASRFPVNVLVVLRQPLNVLSSWKEMGWLHDGSDPLGELDPASARQLEEAFDLPRTDAASPVEQAAELIGLLNAALVDGARRHPEWTVVAHEELCEQPHESFRAAAAAVGLGWDRGGDDLLDQLNQPGAGYETTRVAAGLEDVWRTRLTSGEIDAARSVLQRFDSETAK
jgi:hypothetical protein